VAILNHSQIQELRNPKRIPVDLSGCPLGHLKTKILEFHLVENWDHFLWRVRELMHMWGDSHFFTENNLEAVSKKMFHFIIIELCKLKLKRIPHAIPLVEEAWRGYPDK
jgi:hypothetical protein